MSLPWLDAPAEGAGGPVQGILEEYFDGLRALFETARGARLRRLRIAGESLGIHFAGETTASLMGPAFDHLPASDTAQPSVYCADEASEGVRLPPPPWRWPSAAGAGQLRFSPESLPFRAFSEQDGRIVRLFRSDTGCGFFWTKDARSLGTPHLGSPLVSFIHAWALAHGLILVHGACVGTAAGAALVVGPGGAGKSTIALACLQAGMRYLGDDYCLVRPGPKPVAYCLYRTGKLEAGQMARFPDLAAMARRLESDPAGKPVVFLDGKFREQIALELPLRAVIVPHFDGRAETSFGEASAADALRAAAPSTLLQLPGEGPLMLRRLAETVRAVPAFRLHTGSRLASIPPVVSQLIGGSA